MKITQILFIYIYRVKDVVDYIGYIGRYIKQKIKFGQINYKMC